VKLIGVAFDDRAAIVGERIEGDHGFYK
jgi:hypothetical protein